MAMTKWRRHAHLTRKACLLQQRISIGKLIHRPTYAPKNIQFMTGIKILYVSAQGCRPQGVIFFNKGIQANANLDIALPLLQECKYKSSLRIKTLQF